MLVVIGAGPYGIATAAAAAGAGIETVVVGRPLSFWTDHMPAGMYLRSGPDWHLDAAGVHTFAAFLEERGIAAADIDPVPIAVFLDYARWFQSQKHLTVRECLVTGLRADGDGSFLVSLDNGQTLAAGAVVAAPGVRYFQHRPGWSRPLPAALCAHTCELVRFGDLAGARVLIVGGRQSAYEWAALAGEHGAETVDIVHRHDVPRFERVSWNFTDPYLEQTLAAPGWWRTLPAAAREAVGREFWAAGRLTLEWWLAPRLRGERFRRHPGTSVVSVTAGQPGAARVALSDGTSLSVDRIILATGYQADLARVPYLAGVLGSVATAGGFPVLDETFQSTLPGLYLPGFTGTRDFGPFFGFTKGCPAAAALVTRGLTRSRPAPLRPARGTLPGRRRAPDGRIGAVDPAVLEAFGLDPDVLHLNHGAFGVAPGAVRRSAAAWRERAERNPHRFNRVEVGGLVAAARERAAGFLGVDPARAAWVRNVSEGVSAVLGSLPLRPGDELVTSTHGYGAVRKALARHAARAGARVVEADFPVGAGDDVITAAYGAACSPRTRLVVVDRITSPTAAVIPVAAVAAAARAAAGAGVTVLADAAHAPGQLDDDIAALGADHWVGNLHKWAYTPRGSAILWSRPGADVTPGVLSWNLEDGYAASFDYPGTWDYAGWLAAADGLAYWAALGGWDAVARHAALAADGQQRVAEALGVTLEGLGAVPAPAMRLVPLPDGTLTAPGDADALYEALSRQRVEVAPVYFGGAGYLRVAAAPYNTADDYTRLAGVVRELLGRS